MTRWYARLRRQPHRATARLPEPLEPDDAADQRLVDAVGHDLRGDDGQATATAVRMIWTGDHLDAARRLQGSLIEPARTAASVNASALTCGATDACTPGRRSWRARLQA